MDEPDEKLSQNDNGSAPDDQPDLQEEGENLNLHNGHHNGKEEIGNHSALNGSEEIGNYVTFNSKEETAKQGSRSEEEETAKRGVIKVRKGMLSGGAKRASLIDTASNQSTLPAPVTRERSFPDVQPSVLRRTRVNRLILRKRLNER